ncbi:MAG: carboxypeptidase-like regulatory domain-containing protein [Bacteroidetes bacterium]|nr:carboxypeptidase-like regulatory domain-containing protein [Bacteroidota bacterium]
MKGVVLLTFVILLAFAFYSNAQTLSGTVKDESNSEPLIGANVVIKGTSIGVVTDEDGKFSLDVGNRSFPITLMISYVGFVTRDFTVNEVSSKLSFRLEADRVVLSEVQITGSRLSEKAKQSPLTVESMDQIAIKETPAFNFYEGLGQLKGVDITSASLGFKIINTRGFNSTSPVRSLQIIDGVDNQAPGLNFSLGNFLGAPDLDVLKVDLIVGASSAYYGPNAFNGVISMTTKDPFQTPGLSVSLKFGERELFEGAIRWDQVIKNKEGKDKLAYKLNGYVMRAYDWEATNLDPVYDAQDGKDNPGGYDAVNRYGDEFYFAHDYTGSTANFPGLNRFYRTGYMEKNLVDYNTRNYKATGALHYWLTDSIRLILASSFGSGTTIYQGDNRYAVKDILFFQNRIEVRQDNKFFLRAYATNENSGNSYDAYFTSILMTQSAKSDVNWGTDYYTYYSTYAVPYIQSLPDYPQFVFVPGCDTCYQAYLDAINAYLLTIPGVVDSFHNLSRNYADNSSLSPGEHPFYQPGTPEFDSLFTSIISKESFSEGGSKFYDRSALYHIHGEYIFKPKFADITVGANYRMYRPNSHGTIFSDTAGRVITNDEYGVYGGIEKWLMDQRLKLNATIRMDKNENFPYLFSPAASVVYLAGQNVFRASFSSAIRNPTLTDQYLYYNVGRAILVGNITGFDSLVTLESLFNYIDNQKYDSLVFFNVAPVRPEEVKTAELGYRTSLFKHLFLDMEGYYSWYKYFIGYNLGALIDYNAIFNRLNGLTVYRVASNATDQVTTMGFSLGLNYYFKEYYTISGNYSFNRLDLHGSTDPIIPAYNTPENKFNIGVSGREIHSHIGDWRIIDWGFSVNYRWVQGFLYEGSPQFTGFVPTYGKLDVQINKSFNKIHLNVKVGASNVLNNMKYEVYGGPYVGRLAYINAVFDWGKR